MALQKALRTLEEEDRQVRAITGQGFTPRGYNVRQKSIFDAELSSQRQASAFGLEREKIDTQKEQWNKTFAENTRRFDVGQANLDRQRDDANDAAKLSGIGSIIGMGGDILDIVSGGKSLMDIFGGGGGEEATGGGTDILSKAKTGYEVVKAGLGLGATGATASGLASGAAGAAGVNAAGAGAGGVGGAFGGATPAMTSTITGTGTPLAGGVATGAGAVGVSGLASGAAGAAGVNAAGAGMGGVGGAFGGATPAMTGAGVPTAGIGLAGGLAVGGAAAIIAAKGYETYKNTQERKGIDMRTMYDASIGNVSGEQLIRWKTSYPGIKNEADALAVMKYLIETNPSVTMESLREGVSGNYYRDPTNPFSPDGPENRESPTWISPAQQAFVRGEMTYDEYRLALGAEKTERGRALKFDERAVNFGSNKSSRDFFSGG